LSIGVILLIVAVSAGSSGGGTDSGDNSASSDGGGKKDEGKSGSVGQALENAGTTYEVTNVEQTQTIGDPDIGGATADGTFIVVDLSLTNNKDETKTFSDSSAKIVTTEGKSYKTSDKAVFAFEGDQSLLLKDIQPDLTTKGKLAFELPPSKVSGSKLVVEDLFGSGEITVALGL
jgi:hypothetical protein